MLKNHNKDDLLKLISRLPDFLQWQIKAHQNKETLIEIILDLGKRPEARFATQTEYLAQKIISWQDLEYITQRISKFNTENRAGITRTLHRISCVRNRQFLIIGLTCRIGRSLFGTVCKIQDLLQTTNSILILGNPGVGKTTIIREISRVLADELGKRVIVIDTSNEIGGDSDIPHFSIGRARRFQTSESELQHQVMIEAVENHMPQVIIIDEIGTDLEVLAAKIIAEKGVQLVGTTHGNSIKNLVKNPSLVNLIGGIQYVTLSDEEAKKRRSQKTILERKAAPTFTIIIELTEQNRWIIHENITNAIDKVLMNIQSVNQIRSFKVVERPQLKCSSYYHMQNLTAHDNEKHLKDSTWLKLNINQSSPSENFDSQTLFIYPYSISVNILQEILLRLGVKFKFTRKIKEASLILGLKKDLRQNEKLKIIAKKGQVPIYSLNEISMYQIIRLLQIIKIEQNDLSPHTTYK